LTISPLKAVRAHCLWCCNQSADDVNHCAATRCPLHPYRFGRNPDLPAVLLDTTLIHPAERPTTRTEAIAQGATALTMIRRRCLDCAQASAAEVKRCEATTCSLWPFRLGRNPNRAGIGFGSRPEGRLPSETRRSRSEVDRTAARPSRPKAKTRNTA
jgi:hypothetical protein